MSSAGKQTPPKASAWRGQAGAVRGDRGDGVPGQGRARRTVLRAVGLDGADAADRRCAAGNEIRLRLFAPPRCRSRSTCPRPAACSARRPKRGDVVVFRWPGDRSQAWVKRVVGLPGDRIQMRQGQLFINDRAAALRPDGIGEAEDDNGGFEPAYRYVETLPGGVCHEIFKLRDNGRLDNTPEVTVPPGHLFVMGDNRDNSADSRVPRARGRRRHAADRRSGRPRRRRGRLVGPRHPQPAGLDLAVRLPPGAVLHLGALREEPSR